MRFDVPNTWNRLLQSIQCCLNKQPLPSLDYEQELNVGNDEGYMAAVLRCVTVLCSEGKPVTAQPSKSVAERNRPFSKLEGREDLAEGCYCSTIIIGYSDSVICSWGFPAGSVAYVVNVHRSNKDRLPSFIHQGMSGEVQHVMDGRLIVSFNDGSSNSSILVKFTKADMKCCLSRNA